MTTTVPLTMEGAKIIMEAYKKSLLPQLQYSQCFTDMEYKQKQYGWFIEECRIASLIEGGFLPADFDWTKYKAPELQFEDNDDEAWAQLLSFVSGQCFGGTPEIDFEKFKEKGKKLFELSVKK